ncbi:MAG: hypothetical protein R2831_06225 [Chitinophagaceae bacterium]
MNTLQKIPLLFLCLIQMQALAQLPTFNWAKGTSSTSLIDGANIVQDNSGNVICIGSFSQPTDFDPNAGVVTLSPTLNGYPDVFVCKYNSLGNLLWAKKFGGSFDDNAIDAITDATGNIYITGNFFGTCDFDPDPILTYNLTSAGGMDGYICKLNTNGDFQWVQKIGGSSDDEGLSLGVDATNMLYVTGYFRSIVDFDPSAATFSRTSAGVEDAYIAKFSSTGTFITAYTFGGTGYDVVTDITFDNTNNIYCTGSFNATADFDPATTTTFNLTSDGSNNAFILKLNNIGTLAWAKKITAFNTSNGLCIEASPLGNILAAGNFTGTIDIDPGTATQYISTNGGSDTYLINFDPNGNVLYNQRIGGTSSDVINQIKYDLQGNYYITGSFSNTVDYDPGPNTNNLTSYGSIDAYFAKYDANGNYLWAIHMGGTGVDFGRRIVLNSGGYYYTSGRFTGTADFDPSAAASNTSTQVSNVSGSYVTKHTDLALLPQTTQLHVTCFIQGYYQGASTLSNVLLNQGVASGTSSNCDSLTVELRSTVAPHATLFSQKAMLASNGSASFTFPAATNNQSYYIVLKHRNTIETWSANPVLLTTNTSYNFSTAATKAYGDNQIDIFNEGIFSLYNGDVNNDNFIDIFDFLDWDIENQNFSSGYYNADINGDGFVDIFDFLLWDNNNQFFISSITP